LQDTRSKISCRKSHILAGRHHEFFLFLHPGPELGDFVTGKDLTEVYSLEAPGYKVIMLLRRSQLHAGQ
jgi:hypothetical protein